MIDVILVGNPNTGKTTLYNTLTGAHEHVGNWHGVTVEQYTLAAKRTENVTDAVINAFWLKDPATGATYKAEVTGKEDDLVITVPYMTTSIANWTVYITPAEYTYVTKNGDDDSIEDQIYSGGFKAHEIGFADGSADEFLPLTGDSTKLYAFNKNDPEVKEVYTIHVVLDKDSMTTGHALTDLEFTAQPTTNDSDKDVYRAIRDTQDTSRNLFNAEVEQETNGNRNVGTVNLPIPLSLTGTDDLGIEYQNIATDYKTRDNEGTVFGVKDTGSSNYLLKPLQLTVSDDKEDKIIGSILKNDGDGDNTYSQIIVLPDETARKVLTADPSIVNENPKPGKILVNKAEKDGTLYNVKIDPQPAQSGSELKSMSVGDTELTVRKLTLGGVHTGGDFRSLPLPGWTVSGPAEDFLFFDGELADAGNAGAANAERSATPWNFLTFCL